MHVREATIDDCEPIQNLLDQYYRHMHDLEPEFYLPMTSHVKPIEEVVEMLREADSVVLVVEYNQTVIGMVCVRDSGIADVSFLRSRRYGLVRYIVVDEAHRRLGCGRELMKHVILWCEERGLMYLELTAWHSNRSAVMLYESMGFRPLTMQMGVDLQVAKTSTNSPDSQREQEER
jgi:ribosomal protein S18 acetylase RimI-like enzyme